MIDEALALLVGCTTFVQPVPKWDVVPDDPDDNRVMECAVAAGSKYIVTGDNDLLRLGNYSGIAILKVADFLKLLEQPNV